MKLTMIGTGYVGLVSGTCFAYMGNTVHCVDIDPKKIEFLNQGHCPIFEPGLEDLLKASISRDLISFSTQIEEGVHLSDVIFIAVGTPSEEDGSANLEYVFNAATSIGQYMNHNKIIVTKSTVPVGTGQKIEDIIREQLNLRKKDLDFSVLSNPEFLREGCAVEDFMKPDRVILGGKETWALDDMKKLYRSFLKDDHPVMVMDRVSAELTKYASNSMLATRISFMNELSSISEKVGADINLVRKGMGSDPRIGPQFLYPGIGYGGSCFPKDIRALRNTAKTLGCPTLLLDSVDKVNQNQKLKLYEQCITFFGDNLIGKKFAIWGLAFKPDTDDTREAPSKILVSTLQEKGATLILIDPEAAGRFQAEMGDLPGVSYGDDPIAILEGVDGLFICTEWGIFRNPPFPQMIEKMKNPVIFDGRNLFEPQEMLQMGFTYFSIGRKAVFQNL